MEKSFKYFSVEVAYLLLALLFLARPSTIFTNIDPRINLVGFLIYTLPCLFLIKKHQIQFGQKFFIIITIYSIWVGIHNFIDLDFKLLSYIIIYIHILVAYVLIRTFHAEIFSYFWKIVTALTVLDILCWGLTHFIDLNTLATISPFAPTSDTSSASFLIFNSPGLRYDGLGLLGLRRNCGFAWEPGLYGSILVTAIFFNLAENDYRIKGNFPLYILLIGLFTTFSTTAYSAILILFTIRYVFLLKSGINFTSALRILVLIGVILFANKLPFMNEKIQEDANLENTLYNNKDNIKWLEKERQIKTVKRSEGLVLDYLNYKNSPVWGYGIDPTNSFMQRKISPYLMTSNDLTSFLAKWGGVFTILLFLLFIWNSYFLRNYILYDNNSFLCIFLVIAVSYSLSLCALMMCFLLYRLFEEDDEIDYIKSLHETGEEAYEDYNIIEEISY